MCGLVALGSVIVQKLGLDGTMFDIGAVHSYVSRGTHVPGSVGLAIRRVCGSSWRQPVLGSGNGLTILSQWRAKI